MVQALSSSTSFNVTSFRFQPSQLLTSTDGMYYSCSKPIPIKRSAFRKIKVNENCVRRFCLDPHQLKSKQAVRQVYRSMRAPHYANEQPIHSSLRQTDHATGQRKSKTHVRFSQAIDVYHLPERTVEDKHRCWYSKADYQRFGNERKNTVQAIEEIMLANPFKSDMVVDQNLDLMEETILGVEQYIQGKDHIFRRKFNMLQHTRSVLKQQQQHHDCHLRHSMQQRNMQPYIYPKNYSFDASNYYTSTRYQPHPASNNELYHRYSSQLSPHLCATTMQYQAMCANPFIHQHALHVL